MSAYFKQVDTVIFAFILLALSSFPQWLSAQESNQATNLEAYMNEQMQQMQIINYGWILPDTITKLELLDTMGGTPSWRAELLEGKTTGISFQLALRPGGPADLDTAEAALRKTTMSTGLKLQFKIPDRYVLALRPPKPIAIPAGKDVLRLWIYGNNRRHRWSVEFSNAKGELIATLPGWEISFLGWNHMMIPIPKDFTAKGAHLTGLIFSCDPLDLGSQPQYAYLSMLSAGVGVFK